MKVQRLRRRPNSIRSVRHHQGFTLVELLVVIAIVALLTTIGVVSLNQARAKGRDAQRLENTRQITKALEIYISARGQYPADNNWAGTMDGRPALDGGCITESSVNINDLCSSSSIANPLPLSPNFALGERYRYIGYAADKPSGGGGYTCAYAGRQCLSFGINVVLETSISGLSAGAHCVTKDGFLGDPKVSIPCPLPFPS